LRVRLGVEVESRQRIELRLEERLQELLRIRATMRAASAGMRDSELAHIDNHPGDSAGDLVEEELEETEEIFLAEGERRIAEARRALAEGRYGMCRECGRKIPPARLDAAPEAVRCVDCQRLFEGRHRQQMRV
jgi:DnaK suppressor protein